MKKIQLYIKSSFDELLKKVTWPSREETTRLTMLVLAVSVAIGAMLGVLDFLFATISDQVLF